MGSNMADSGFFKWRYSVFLRISIGCSRHFGGINVEIVEMKLWRLRIVEIVLNYGVSGGGEIVGELW